MWHAQQWEFVMAGGSPAQCFFLHRALERMLGMYLSKTLVQGAARKSLPWHSLLNQDMSVFA